MADRCMTGLHSLPLSLLFLLIRLLITFAHLLGILGGILLLDPLGQEPQRFLLL
jgi:hypothetical protein